MVSVSLVSAAGSGIFWGAVAAVMAIFVALRREATLRVLAVVPIAVVAGVALHVAFQRSPLVPVSTALLPWALSFVLSGSVVVGVAGTNGAFDDQTQFLKTLALAVSIAIPMGAMWSCTAQNVGRVVAEGEAMKPTDGSESQPAGPENVTNAVFILEAEKAVREHLYDPEAARFKDVAVHVSEGGGSPPVCGFVNGKNRLGGYTGYHPFISTGVAEATYLATENPGAVQDAWKVLCTRPVRQ